MRDSPRSIEKIGARALRIIWEDGHSSEYRFAYLRRNCPCALCRDEFSGRPLLDPSAISELVTADRESLVGRYGLSFSFSDGHGTGIYSFEALRALCPCFECAGRKPSPEAA